MIKNYRVYLGFAQGPDAEVDAFTTNVIASMTGNAAFPNPPVPIAPSGPVSNSRAKVAINPGDAVPGDLTSLQAAYQDAMAAAAQGGKQTTAVKNAARDAVVDALRKTAMYVQTIASHDLAMLLSSGFDAVSTNRTRTPLDKPVIQALVNETSGQLVLRGVPVLNARSYQVQMMANGNGNTWADMGDFTGARRIVLSPVTPGTTYTARMRGVGGSTKYSDWSDPVSHMAT